MKYITDFLHQVRQFPLLFYCHLLCLHFTFVNKEKSNLIYTVSLNSAVQIAIQRLLKRKEAVESEQ